MGGWNPFYLIATLTAVLVSSWTLEQLLEEPVLPEELEPPWLSEPLEEALLLEVREPAWTSESLEESPSAERSLT